MRFYEFRRPRKTVFRSFDPSPWEDNEFSYETIAWQLNEDVDQTNLNEFRAFTSGYITDPSELIEDETYFAVELFAHSISLNLFIRYLDRPVIYQGFRLGDFIFKEDKRKYHYYVPQYDDTTIETKLGPYLKMTTVFNSPDQQDSFLTMVRLRFGGKWTLHERELSNQPPRPEGRGLLFSKGIQVIN